MLVKLSILSGNIVRVGIFNAFILLIKLSILSGNIIRVDFAKVGSSFVNNNRKEGLRTIPLGRAPDYFVEINNHKSVS